jgi:DNA-binding response OmpR family regulator
MVAGVAARLLIVDDDRDLRRLLARHLEGAGYELEEAADARAAREALAKGKFDLMLCDISMPGESGLSLAKDVIMRNPKMPVLMVSAMYSPSLGRKVEELGAKGYLVKPVSKEELLNGVDGVLKGSG